MVTTDEQLSINNVDVVSPTQELAQYKTTMYPDYESKCFIDDEPVGTMPDFIHEPPEGYAYEVKPFKRNVVAIWLQHPDHYNFSSDRVSTIWGFTIQSREPICLLMPPSVEIR